MLIVVEGKSDEEFLRQYMLYKKIDISFKIIQNDSNGLNNATITKIKKGLDDGKKVYIIFDADKSYDKTLKRIKKKLKKQLVDSADTIGVFLFPNNKDSGELETLLIDIAKQPQFVECFDNYVECVKSKDIDNINVVNNINKKSKMFAYREVIGLEKFLKQLKCRFKQIKLKQLDDDKTPRNFLATNEIFSQYFDFDSPKLEPLREFLCK